MRATTRAKWTRSGNQKLFRCEKCGAGFPTNPKLHRHLGRKRPCDPIIDCETLPGSGRRNQCAYCGRVYSRPDSLKRHMATCPIATSEAGRELLYAHNLKKQRAQFEQELAKRDKAAAELVNRLRSLNFADLAEASPPEPAEAPFDPAGPGAAARVMVALAALMRHAGGGSAPAPEDLRLLASAVALFRSPPLTPRERPVSAAEDSAQTDTIEKGRAEAGRVFDILSLVVAK